ncbi:hypothetical protein F4813DRAFT_394629 [Daldinia decipiens]|uniref:uncharacterized protein n=1 Tax=Daldinia decipiens TaxID=326647 RepID=UPI0020C44294|nr:uncharacterized protein F4813DRAFT_394629 [Daldinia decipiens]KAI1652511.1 hypothetical protein F4813DRAFT_394629 [Daldinia decipiens]
MSSFKILTASLFLAAGTIASPVQSDGISLVPRQQCSGTVGTIYTGTACSNFSGEEVEVCANSITCQNTDDQTGTIGIGSIELSSNACEIKIFSEPDCGNPRAPYTISRGNNPGNCYATPFRGHSFSVDCS